MDYFNDVLTTFLGLEHVSYICGLLRVRKGKISFHQWYLNLCSKDEQRSYGFRMTRGWVPNDRIFILEWTVSILPLWTRWMKIFREPRLLKIWVVIFFTLNERIIISEWTTSDFISVSSCPQELIQITLTDLQPDQGRGLRKKEKEREWYPKEETGSLDVDTHTPERTSTDCVFMPKPVVSMLMTGSSRSTFIPLSLKFRSLNIVTWGVMKSYRRAQNIEMT